MIVLIFNKNFLSKYQDMMRRPVPMYYERPTINISISDEDGNNGYVDRNELGYKVLKCFDWMHENPRELNFIIVALLFTLFYIIYLIIAI